MSIINKLIATFGVAILIGGCASLNEIISSSMEVPTLERQMLRVSVGMTIVRQNNLMAYQMPISADALWPKQINQDINTSTKKRLSKIINKDPYYATVRFTDIVQRDSIGFDSSVKNQGDGIKFAALLLNQKISPLAYEAAYKLDLLYGSNPKNWPRIFDADNSLENYLEFHTGSVKVIESIDGDVYYSLGEAIISLLPLSLQKDLDSARIEMNDSVESVGNLEAQKGTLESSLKTNNKNRDKSSINEELAVVDFEIKNAKALNEEKEKIYFTLLDSAIVALSSDLNIDDENYVKLAYNIRYVAEAIKDGSWQAYISFGLALRKIQSNNMISNFPQELESLAVAKLYVPIPLQKKYNKRVVRVGKNALYFLPNLFMGSFYAYKQSSLASKYEEISELIIEAYEVQND